MGAPDLRLAQVLVVGEDVRHGGRDGGVEHRVDGDVERGRVHHEDLHVLVLDAHLRGEPDVVGHEPRIWVLPGRAAGDAGDLRGPRERPHGDHLRHVVAPLEPAHAPRHEAVREHRADRLATEGRVVAGEEALEVLAAPLAVDLAEEPLREARRLHDPEALQHGGLVRHELPEQLAALLYVPGAHARTGAGELAVHGARGGCAGRGRGSK